MIKQTLFASMFLTSTCRLKTTTSIACFTKCAIKIASGIVVSQLQLSLVSYRHTSELNKNVTLGFLKDLSLR